MSHREARVLDRSERTSIEPNSNATKAPTDTSFHLVISRSPLFGCCRATRLAIAAQVPVQKMRTGDYDCSRSLNVVVTRTPFEQANRCDDRQDPGHSNS